MSRFNPEKKNELKRLSDFSKITEQVGIPKPTLICSVYFVSISGSFPAVPRENRLSLARLGRSTWDTYTEGTNR